MRIQHMSNAANEQTEDSECVCTPTYEYDICKHAESYVLYVKRGIHIFTRLIMKLIRLRAFVFTSLSFVCQDS